MEEFIQQEKFRVSIYMLLADCFKQSPSMDSVIALAKIIESVEPKDKKMMDDMLDELKISSDTTINRDYIDLFIGPRSLTAPPYGSIYMEEGHQIMGKSTSDAVRLYNSVGFRKANSFKQPEDHIQVELEFMAVLINKTIDAIMNNDYDDALELLNRQDEFLKNHIGSWIRPFAQAIINSAKTLYYKNIAAIAEEFIKQDVEAIELVKHEFKELISK